ncbi:MAG: hypothetical protein ACAI44_28145 [Candidatus Sericytochromatia bacterium]
MDFDQQECRLNINGGTEYRLALNQLKRICVEGSEQLKYQPSPHAEKIQQCLQSLGITSGTCVDIGAFDGVNHSNTFQLFQAGWSGLALEYEYCRFASLAHTYRAFPNVDLARVQVTPDNVCLLLQAHGIPHNFDFLSLDIDSYDYYVLAALLENFRPTLIMTEINEVIPPPVKFAVKYDRDFRFDVNKRFYGQSLAQLHELCQRKRYTILDMYYMDVVLIDTDYLEGEAPSLEDIYNRGLLTRGLPDYYANYPFDVRKLLAASPEQALELVCQGYGEFAGQFVCSL